MKKSKIAICIIFILGLIIVSIYYDVSTEREVTLIEEYQVHSKRETLGKLWKIIRSEKVRKIIMEDFGIEIPDVDFDEFYLLWSDGRKIEKLSYKIISKYQWQFNIPRGDEILGKEHYLHTAVIYKINKVFIKQNLD